MLAQDEVEVDDAMVKVGASIRRKKFMNVRKVRTLSDQKENFSVDGGSPLFVIYLGVSKYAKRYERIFSGIEEIFAESGGFFVGMAQLFSIIVMIGSSVNFQTRMIYLVIG